MSQIWDQTFIDGLAESAEKDAVNRVDYLFFRFSMSSEAGKSVYTLPNYVRKIERITWRGYKVWPLSWREMCEINPATAVVSETTKTESSQSRPLYYCLHPTNYRNIRFYPTPNETIALDDSRIDYTDGIRARVIVSCYRAPFMDDYNYRMPSWIRRRLIKAYALRAAYLKEGKGQNLKASQYWDKKYSYLTEMFKTIVNGCYVSKRNRLGDGSSNFGKKPARPILPPNFEG